MAPRKKTPTAKQQAKRAYENWVATHPAPECRALRQHAIVENIYSMPGRPRFLLAVRHCSRQCGTSEKRVLDARTMEVLATFDRTHGDDYLLPAEASPHVGGRVPRADFQALLVEPSSDLPNEWLEGLASALERKKKSNQQRKQTPT